MFNLFCCYQLLVNKVYHFKRVCWSAEVAKSEAQEESVQWVEYIGPMSVKELGKSASAIRSD